jgi:hypothetical protein
MYVDCWGTYTASENGTLDLVISTGNYVPDDPDVVGRFPIDGEGRLMLHDMWLGTSAKQGIPRIVDTGLWTGPRDGGRAVQR